MLVQAFLQTVQGGEFFAQFEFRRGLLGERADQPVGSTGLLTGAEGRGEQQHADQQHGQRCQRASALQAAALCLRAARFAKTAQDDVARANARPDFRRGGGGAVLRFQMALDVLRAGNGQQNVLLRAIARKGFPDPAGFFGRKRRDGFDFEAQRSQQVFASNAGGQAQVTFQHGIGRQEHGIKGIDKRCARRQRREARHDECALPVAAGKTHALSGKPAARHCRAGQRAATTAQAVEQVGGEETFQQGRKIHKLYLLRRVGRGFALQGGNVLPLPRRTAAVLRVVEDGNFCHAQPAHRWRAIARRRLPVCAQAKTRMHPGLVKCQRR